MNRLGIFANWATEVAQRNAEILLQQFFLHIFTYIGCLKTCFIVSILSFQKQLDLGNYHIN